jgi:predicted DNA-binding transcriptional regulator AlpA
MRLSPIVIVRNIYAGRIKVSNIGAKPEHGLGLKRNHESGQSRRVLIRASKAMGEILTVDELAALLKMSKRQIYTMCEKRTRNGSMKDHPLPVLKINGNLRFRKAAIEEWVQLVEGKAA